jgi:leucyl/phenylalanyl-tRNA--protein transferase
MPFEYQFPDPRTADADGLLAVGGDLSIESLVAAYSRGIFPWYEEDSPILWWSPDPRLILYPGKFRISGSLDQKIRTNKFRVKTDGAFEEVIRNCAAVNRDGQRGTWITKDMMQAFIRLHRAGFAHSFETWHNDRLVGGLYGVSLGRAFFGESMFYLMTDASKVALYYLVEWSKLNDFHFIDAQQSTSHLKSLGAEEVPRIRFLEMLGKSLEYPTIKGTWKITGG